jgi:electron transfer flavoprotein beta subunit
MKICVCVKEVPPATVPKRLDPETRFLLRTGRGHLNTPDSHALEEALSLKDSLGDRESEVVTVTMAPEHAADPLRHGLAMGADRAVLIADDALVGSDLVATSRVLSSVLQREAPDLVLFGWEGTDANGAMLWSAVAERLHLPVVSRVWELTVAESRVRATRQMEYGFDVVEAPMPCVVALAGVTNAPRHPSLKSVIASKRTPVEVLSVAELDLSRAAIGAAGSRTTVLDLAPPPSRATAEVIADDENAADRLLDYLSERGVL